MVPLCVVFGGSVGSMGEPPRTGPLTGQMNVVCRLTLCCASSAPQRQRQEISFAAPDQEEGSEIVVDKALVQARVNDLLVESDVSKYIL